MWSWGLRIHSGGSAFLDFLHRFCKASVFSATSPQNLRIYYDISKTNPEIKQCIVRNAQLQWVKGCHMLGILSSFFLSCTIVCFVFAQNFRRSSKRSVRMLSVLLSRCMPSIRPAAYAFLTQFCCYSAYSISSGLSSKL